MKKILLAGGGVSGGHITTLVSVIQEVLSRKVEVDFFWIGSGESTERQQAQRFSIPYKKVFTGKIRRYFSLRNIIDLLRIPIGVFQSVFIIKKFSPDVIFASGGYASVPASLAGFLLGVPVVIHESDVMPGLANRFIARIAKKVLISFEEAGKWFHHPNVLLVGVPIRGDVCEGNRKRGFQTFSLNPSKPVLLVIGGGQGSLALNRVVQKALPRLLSITQIIHACGEKHYAEIQKNVPRDLARDIDSYRVFGYLGMKLADAYAITTLALTRAGAHTLNELCFYGIPSIIVPHAQFSSGHQAINAEKLARSGASIVIQEHQFTPEFLVETVRKLLTDRDTLQAMRTQAKNHNDPLAAQKIVDAILKND